MNVIAGSRPPWYPLPRSWRAYAVATPGSVLLETGGGLGDDHVSTLFTQPQRVLQATSAAEVAALLDELEAATAAGLYAAGSLDYEAGYALLDITATAPARPLARFGIYAQRHTFDHHTGIASGPAFDSIGNAAMEGAPVLSPPQIALNRPAYAAKFDAVQELLASGDTYQVNLTTHVEATLQASPLALYEALLAAQPVDFAAIVHLDDSLVLSLSPELFFRIDADRRIATRPMKGTAARGTTPEEDAKQRAWLEHDEKNHAEHVMIVDLLRNDLGRICAAGSVRGENLFHVEPYPTLFQMTSTVSGTLRTDTRLRDLVQALFPSGSVTGAPKRRTMEIIRDVEEAPRGVYTGAIGSLAPNAATFSVPIRTLEVRGTHISMGVGGGVVADSTADGEYDECLLKAAFLTQASAAPQLIETLLWSNGYPLLELHLERLAHSAAQLGFAHNQGDIRGALTTAAQRFAADTRVRLLLARDGGFTITHSTLTGPAGDLRVRLSRQRVDSADPWLQHKTTRRGFYDRALAEAHAEGCDEVLFLNERDEVAEGAISTIFIEREGKLFTPPLACGALPGVLRQHLLDTRKDLVEKVLTRDDLVSATTVYVGNALRGFRTVASLHIE